MAPHMALFVGAGLAIGAIFTHAVLGGLLALLVWIGLQLRQLARLHAWLVAPNRHVLPDTSGVWGEVFDMLIDLQRKNRKRKKRLASMLAEFQASTADLPDGAVVRSEEKTSERQSLMRNTYDVFCVKKQNKKRLRKTYSDRN